MNNTLDLILKNKIKYLSNNDSFNVSNNSVQNEYIFDLKYCQDFTRLYASASDGKISSYDPQTMELLNNFQAHNDKINSFHTSNYSNDTILTCSDDKSVKFWDTRTTTTCFSITINDEVNDIALGLGGMLLSVAHSNIISFYDVRMQNNSRRLGLYDDVHNDMITQLQFLSRDNDSMLISAGEDGLIAIYDSSVSSNDSTLISILNSESPVRKIGLFGSKNEGLYALSTNETLSIWHYPSAQRINNFDSIRETFGLDYLVDCVYNENNDTLNLIAGKYSGDGIILNIDPSCAYPISSFSQGHTDTIRCLTYNWQSQSIITGGEDSLICNWTAATNGSTSNISNSINVFTGKVKLNKKNSLLRHRPY